MALASKPLTIPCAGRSCTIRFLERTPTELAPIASLDVVIDADKLHLLPQQHAVQIKVPSGDRTTWLLGQTWVCNTNGFLQDDDEAFE